MFVKCSKMIKMRKLSLLVVHFIIMQNDVSHAQLLGPNLLSEDGQLDFTGLATKYGHRPVQYEVITEDGYILTLFRIPGRSKYPVLLMHGLLDTSDTWLIRGENSLGISLAKDGYDVWFGNSRGNRYSTGHISLNPDKDPSYWNWSFHELGYYDLPAIIDTILNQTQAPDLTAIGHSRGNQIFYILGSTRKEYNSKINVMIALAPICYLHNTQPPLSTLIDTFPQLNQLLDAFQLTITQVLGYNCTATRLVRALCTYPIIGPQICLNFIIFPIVGFDPMEFEQSYVRTWVGHLPAGTSWRDLLHFAQLRSRREFAPYDFGTAQNLLIYNSPEPPRYNLTQVKMPVALLAGRNDRLSTLPDVDLLKNQLPNVVDYTINRRALFNHADDVWGRRMRVYLFPDIYRVLQKYNKAT